MSDVYKNTDGRSDTLNKAAAHDTALYDPNRHDNQIVAVYDSMAQAGVARDALIGAGIPRQAIQVVDHTSGDAGGPSVAEDRNQGGFWGAVKSLFAPAEDVTAYREAIGRGHAMLILTPDATMDRHRAIQILESSHPIDFDAKLEEWRQAGYDQMPNAGGANPAGSDTGYRTGLVEERMRVGQREPVSGPSRVRSYLATRDENVRLQEERIGPGMGTGGVVTNATPGATSSGMNAPRK